MAFHDVPLEDLRSSYNADIAPVCVAAYHGMYPWDGLHDSRYFEKLLLPGVSLLSTRRMKEDFVCLGPGEYEELRDRRMPTLGPARVAISIMTDRAEPLRSAIGSYEGRWSDSTKIEDRDDLVTIIIDVGAVETDRRWIEMILRDEGLADDAILEVTAVPAEFRT